MRTYDFMLPADGSERRYLAHVPSALDPRGPWRVVLMLPGAGATPQWTLEETGWQRTAEQFGFLLIVPEALPLDPSQPPAFLTNPPFWNDGSPRAASAPRDVDDVAFLVALLDDLGQRFPADPRRVCVTGFSNGAGMTFRLAAERAERIAAIAPVVGYCWLDDPRPARPVPSLYVVGTQDPLVPLAGGTVTTLWGWQEQRPPIRDMLDRWRRALSCGEPHMASRDKGVEEIRYAPAAGGVEFLAYLVEGLGHHWPGGRGLLSRRLFGPPSSRVRANDLIGEFFRRFAP
jgi:polyhydroxybutyrate depolymerase